MSDHRDGVSPLNRLIRFFLENKVIAAMLALLFLGWGLLTAPFDWEFGLERMPVPVDAIPDIGENQQIVFTEWMGRSPRDMEDQVTYPLTTALMGVPGVRTVRSHSYFGFSSIYLIFEENVDFYWSRARILEKLNSLPVGTLPDGVRPALGPDATALGQIFWYTLDGRDPQGNPTAGWDLRELRSVQDWYLRYALLATEGVSEVASIGGFVQEYQVDVDPDAMLAHGVSLKDVFAAVSQTNLDVGARNIEINNVEYFIRGLGFIKQIEDIEQAVIRVNDNVPIVVSDVARVTLGPAQRRGALDKGGAEAVGGVVVARFGENPLEVIKNLQDRIAEIAPGLPRKTLADGTESQVTLVPFYDRTGLILETLGTLETALTHQVLVTIIVVLLMVMHIRGSLLISGLLPLSVLMTFIAMKHFGVDANIVALSGIAIAIGTMVDMGIVMVENMLEHLEKGSGETRLETIYRASSEVSGAVLTAVATTVIGFLPVFAMQAAEGKLFRPLAFTKTFALMAAILVSLILLPAFAHALIGEKRDMRTMGLSIRSSGLVLLVVAGFWFYWPLGIFALVWGGFRLFANKFPERVRIWGRRGVSLLAALMVAAVLTQAWLPLCYEPGVFLNYLFVVGLIGGIILFFMAFLWLYPHLLSWAMNYRALFLAFPTLIVVLGLTIWLGFPRVFGWLPVGIQTTGLAQSLRQHFPGLGREFMPPLDEGSFLYMPTTSVHASIDEVMDVMRIQDMGFAAIPEIDQAVGKLGRVNSSLDPAPISMIETVINYKNEYLSDASGQVRRFRFDPKAEDHFRDLAGAQVLAADGLPYKVRGRFVRDEAGQLIPDPEGMPFRQWRPPLDPDLNPGRSAWSGIRNEDDIWDEIVRAGRVPGVTSAPKLQPIATRIVMLSTGLRAPMGVRVSGPDLNTVEQVGIAIENMLQDVPSINAATVFADRIIGKPYLEFEIDRTAIARHGISMDQVQRVIEVAIGGREITTTVEGRERYQVRVRYPRERRDHLDEMQKVLVPTMSGAQIPLGQLAQINYVRGPQVIKSEDTFLVSYVIFDKQAGEAEVDVVRAAQDHIAQMEASGVFQRPPGVKIDFVGNYQNELRASRRLMIVLPLALILIFMILYLQFRAVSTTLFAFSGIAVAMGGGFIMIWCYNQPWFLDFHLFGVYWRDLFQIHPINMSVAIWVGFLALFGIATDDGVIIATYLDQSFKEKNPQTAAEIREATLAAGKRRVRPALMTSATTVIALLPVLTSSGRGADIMIPMAIPTFGGMIVVVISIFVVPVLYSFLREITARG